MKLLAFFLLLLIAPTLPAQIENIHLKQCRQLARERYPLNNDLEKNIESTRLKIESIKTIYFPQIQLTGQFIHLADVPHMTIENPMFSLPVVGKDQYKLAIEARQVLYDGGLTKQRKTLEEIGLKTELQDIEVKLYQLNDQVNEVYFTILLFQEQLKLMEISHLNLAEQLKTVEAGVRHGILMPGDADIIRAEILKAEQKITELHSGKLSGIALLSELMDTTISINAQFEKPIPTNTIFEKPIHRPEHQLFDFQSNKIEESIKLIKAQRFPYLGLFGQFGYGYPGMNMLEDKANILYSFGAHLSWTIWDWGKVKRESQMGRITAEKISSQREIFDKNLRMAIVQETNRITQLEHSIKSDDEIIALRERITQAKSSQLKNGVITSSEYVLELNAETLAKINKQVHEIQLLKAKEKLNILQGNID
jgi:outer membrane protein TolC